MCLLSVIVAQLHTVLTVESILDRFWAIQLVYHFICILLICSCENNNFKGFCHFFKELSGKGPDIEFNFWQHRLQFLLSGVSAKWFTKVVYYLRNLLLGGLVVIVDQSLIQIKHQGSFAALGQIRCLHTHFHLSECLLRPLQTVRLQWVGMFLNHTR